jgi:hypothetical protein
MQDSESLIAKFVERIPLGRAAEPDDKAVSLIDFGSWVAWWTT